MSGSVKGRALLHRSARASAQVLIEREGICAWCGYEVRAGKDGHIFCPRCSSDEIDWIVPTPAQVPAATRTRDAQFTPGTIAYSLLGARVFGRR